MPNPDSRRPKRYQEADIPPARSRRLTQPGERYRGVDGQIGFLLRQAQTAVRRAIAEAIAPLGMSAAQFSLLSVLLREGPVSSASLAKLAMISPQSVGGIVKNMERAGWVSRRPADDHGRIIWIELTAAGRRITEAAQARSDDVEGAMVADLAPSHEKLVRQWLVGCARRFGKRRIKGSASDAED